ncbi:MAG TPA: lipoprotein signal peptidase [Flavobacteriales bacterium]|nr:lipoprotein signal peptidase [Flavobacteriales bacterium]
MRAALITIFSVLLVDQLVKIYIKTHFYLGESYEVFSWFHIHFIENRGMAFGTELGGSGSTWGKLALSVFRLLAIIGIAWYLRKLIRQKAQTLLIVCIGLIFAGAFGNMIDSMFYGLLFSESYELQIAEFLPKEGGYAPFLFGNVVDMVSFSFFPPIFNIADSSISIGVAILVLKQKSFFGKKKDTPAINENTNIPPTDASQSTGDIVS